MADSSRDLVIRAVSKTEQFDLSDVAQDLERTGQAAEDSGKQIDDSFTDAARSMSKVGDAAKDAGRDLDTGLAKGEKAIGDLGDKADTTKRDLSAFMDKIGADAKKAGREVEQGLDRAGEGLATFKDESRQTGRESAASFAGGFGDITDIVQEIGANAFAGLGAVGGALGIAGAAAFGTIISQLTAANEKIGEFRDRLISLGRNVDTTGLDRLNDALDAIQEVGDITGLEKGLRAAGVTTDEFVRALLEGGDIADDVKARLRELGGSAAGLGQFLSDDVRAGQAAFDMLDQYGQGAQQADKFTQAFNERLQEQADAQAKAEQATSLHEQALATIGDSLRSAGDATDELTQLVQDRAQKQADATKSTKDGWADYADGVKLSAKDVIKTLDEQTKNAEQWRDNLLKVQQQGDEQFTAWVSQQPANVAAAYASGTKAQRGAIYAAFQRNVGAQQALGTAQGLKDGQQTVRDAAGNVYTAAKNELTGETILIPVRVALPPNNGPGSAAAAEEATRRRIGTVVIPTYVDVGNVRRWQAGG